MQPAGLWFVAAETPDAQNKFWQPCHIQKITTGNLPMGPMKGLSKLERGMMGKLVKGGPAPGASPSAGLGTPLEVANCTDTHPFSRSNGAVPPGRCKMQHSTAQHSTAQHSTEHQSTAQHSAAHYSASCCAQFL